MKSDSFVPKILLGDDTLQTGPTTLPGRADASIPILERSQLVGGRDGERSADLRSIVSRRFMRMLRAHDRARTKVLAHPR